MRLIGARAELVGRPVGKGRQMPAEGLDEGLALAKDIIDFRAFHKVLSMALDGIGRPLQFPRETDRIAGQDRETGGWQSVNLRARSRW
ncbi:hypothetical protein [Paracoccus yeei]|uniref:hypothetical protein n=1 Tax=Paracoccus yeei TaxID=147645 RepID=UPI0028D53669|nr:hypothetical protein [Paracoccus yeei]